MKLKDIITEGLKDEFTIVDGTKEQVDYFVKKMHYLGKFPTGIQKIFLVVQKLPDRLEPVGMVIYGAPFFTASKFLEPVVSSKDVTELKRHWTSDDIKQKNIESFIISQANKKMKQENPNLKVILTFADEKAGHVGTIYQATNAIYLGRTPDGKHKYMYIVGGNERAIRGLLNPQDYPKQHKTQTETSKEEIVEFNKNPGQVKKFFEYIGMIKRKPQLPL